MNRQRNDCHDCDAYGLNGFQLWCKKCNKQVKTGHPLPCQEEMTPITFTIPAKYIRKLSIYTDIMMENNIVPEGEKEDFLEVRRYLHECMKQ